MACNVFRETLPEDLEHASHQFLLISEVFTLQGVSQRTRRRIRRSFPRHPWHAVHLSRVGATYLRTPRIDTWLMQLRDTKVNLRSIRTVRTSGDELVESSPQ